jgi:hypothetical protein
MNPFELLQMGRPQAASSDRTTDDHRPEPEQTRPASAAPAKASEVDELKHRIEELELLLTKRAPRKNTRKPKYRRKA